MTSQTFKQAQARMAQDAWSRAVDAQRAAEARHDQEWTMESMAAVAAAKKAQEKAWKAMNRAEERAA